MRSFEVITTEANRPSSRLQPERRGAASIQRDAMGIPSGPGDVVARVRRSNFMGTGFSQRIHIFAFGLKSSRNHKTLLSAKLNPVRLDGEPHHPSGFAFAANVVGARDEITERHGFLPAISFHGSKYRPERLPDAMGCSPHGRFSWIQPRHKLSGLAERQRDTGLEIGIRR
jgi:hypothetical protein